MIQPDEITFLIIMQIRSRSMTRDTGDMPRQIIAELAHLIPEKRALYLLSKWESKGWYEYGMVIDGGWLTKEGMQASYAKEWERQQELPKNENLL